jgi:hypothetical protein
MSVPARSRPAVRDPRQFSSFTPAGRRATVYEDVTIDTQPSPARHQVRGYPSHFADGRPAWNADATALRLEDWYAFRDPAQLWERTYYQLGSRYERSIEDAVTAARQVGDLARMPAPWVEFLRQNLQQLAFVDHGIWLLIAVAARDGLSDTVTHCMCFEAGMKQRQAQATVLYAMDLEACHGDFGVDRAKRSFLRDEAWQPARELLERLTTVTDWGERIVAVNLCLEPVLGTLLRRGLLLRGCTVYGDHVLPVLLRCAQLEHQYVTDWTGELARLLVSSTKHGAHNTAVLAGWLDRWLPPVRTAAVALRPLFETVALPLDHEAALAAAQEDAAAACRVIREPAGVTA